jgi:Leucine-rich repeat (LRR) protein
LGQLEVLAELDLSGNRLSGPIPAELGQLGALKTLRLQNNQLSGQEALRLYLQEHNPGFSFNC